jgi:hypothetical protein
VAIGCSAVLNICVNAKGRCFMHAVCRCGTNFSHLTFNDVPMT